MLLCISNNADSINSLGTLCHHLVTHPHSEKAFLDVQKKPPMFQFVTIASGPHTGTLKFRRSVSDAEI